MRRWLLVFSMAVSLARPALAQQGEGGPEISRDRMDAALARFALVEPPVGRVVSEALEHARLSPDDVQAAASRARWSGLLPIARAGVRRGIGQDLSALQTGDTDRAAWSTDDELSIYGTLTFRLDRVVFAREEVPLLREERAVRAERAELVRAVVHVYYERRRLLLERELLGRNDLDHVVRI